MSASKLRRLVTEALLHDDSLDVPGIIWMEHLNLLCGARAEADDFYVGLLGFHPEPGRSWHVNMGSQQLHLAEAPSKGLEHRLTGSVGLTVPSLKAIRSRVARAKSQLSHTCFEVEDQESIMLVTCPWGNTYVCHEVSDGSGGGGGGVTPRGIPRMACCHAGLDQGMSVRAPGGSGIRYIEFRVRRGTVQRIGQFYETIFECKVSYSESTAIVLVGPAVHLVFHDVADRPLTDKEESQQAGVGGGEGVHCCIYISHFKLAYERLWKLGLVWTNPRFAHLDTCDTYEQAVASRQFRFKTLIDLETHQPLLELGNQWRRARTPRPFNLSLRTGVHY
jgi:catechol 2,3-dioxygenase-like lactoylglutathione lyase family enzyme